ncbi:hypothetical protein I7I50_00644 [Histoplasma capsulatum G186AR]|uniref:Uncharacterized protein n=1 Tax=Ajellomyces capsulatus TaxID=5037 RepID=A0A8H7YGM8_AJECA|nr:hypothetical protein I7I52_07912 [Histoplasma capsulatum]QSS72714.1 hypothetical protein I7I50_00644 [Histoplasma capsulatum G186AR]
MQYTWVRGPAVMLGQRKIFRLWMVNLCLRATERQENRELSAARVWQAERTVRASSGIEYRYEIPQWAA